MGERLPGHDSIAARCRCPGKKKAGSLQSASSDHLGSKKVAARGGKGMLVKKSVNIRGRDGFPNPGRCLLLLFTAAALLLSPAPSAWGDSRPKKSVLILFSAQSDHPGPTPMSSRASSRPSTPQVNSAPSISSNTWTCRATPARAISGHWSSSTAANTGTPGSTSSSLSAARPLISPFETATRFSLRSRSSSPECWRKSSSCMTLPADCTGILGVIDFRRTARSHPVPSPPHPAGRRRQRRFQHRAHHREPIPPGIRTLQGSPRLHLPDPDAAYGHPGTGPRSTAGHHRSRLHRPGGRRGPGLLIGGCHRQRGRRGQCPGLRRL